MRVAIPALRPPLTNRQRAALQDRQLAERGELQRDQAAARDELAGRLQRQYGQSLRENRRALEAIGQRQQQGGYLGLLYRMGGRAAADRQATEELENRLGGICGTE